MEGFLNQLGADAHRTAVDKGWYDCHHCRGEGKVFLPPPASLGLSEQCHRCRGTGKATTDIPTSLMLIVSELAEAMEDYRDDNNSQPLTHWGWYKDCEKMDPKPEGFPTELADAIIRILNLCHHLGIDIDAVVKMKMEYNRGREHRHGGKTC